MADKAGLGGSGRGFAGAASGRAKRGSKSRRKPGKSIHRREQCPMGRDPDLEAINARQALDLPLTGLLSDQQVKRAR